MRQYAGYATARESNQRYRYLLAQGQTGLSVAFDLPTQVGLDSDHNLALGEVGKVGVAIDSLADMEILFEGIPLEKVSVSMTINSTAAIILAMYLVLAEKKGIAWKQLTGTIQNDILKEYIARGTYIYPPKASLKIITDILAFCQKEVPTWNTMSISGYHIREAGADAVQELAFTFANAITYIKAAREAGLKIDTFAPRLSFFLAAHNNFFEEIAKFRAARRIWAKIVRGKFHAKNPNSWKLDNNIIRVTLQALASIIGGTQSLHTNSRDEALALPSQESARIALRTQQIIAHESGTTATVDPLGGSYFIENLTSRIETSVNDYLHRIEDLGGMLKAIESGFIQKKIQDSAYAYQKEIEQKKQLVVGLNSFNTSGGKIQFDLYSPPREIEKKQIQKLTEVKKRRDTSLTKKSLQALNKAISDNKNLMPFIIDAVKCLATLGEISDLLKDNFGTYQEAGL